MSHYIGETYSIPLEQGGFCHNKNVDTIAPVDMVHPSCNIWLNEGGIRKRGGTTPVDSVSMGSTEVSGIYDFTLINSNQFILRHTTDGKLWKTNADTIKTGWTAGKIAQFAQDGDTVMICNGADCPVTWNGLDALVTDMTDIPTDWAGSNFPSQMIIHGRGNSIRTWALGCPSDPENIYVTTNGNLTDFSQATVLVFNIVTGHSAGVVGGVEYGNKLLLFGKEKSFIFNDDSSDTANWGYQLSQWAGGAANHRLIVKTPNDIVCMMENGEIYSVSAAQEYGDYKTASLTRPSFLHEWIKTYVNLSHIDDFHAIYDPVLRAVKIFVVSRGGSGIDTALVYFIDRSADKAWVILNNTDNTSGYHARSACLVRAAAGNIKVYTGGYSGKVWKLGETNRNDNGNAYMSKYKTPAMSFDSVRESKRYDQLKVISLNDGSCSITASWWIDGTKKGSEEMNFTVDGDVLGAFILGTSKLGGAALTEKSVRMGRPGKRLQLQVENSEANEDFFLSQMLIDFILLGKRI